MQIDHVKQAIEEALERNRPTLLTDSSTQLLRINIRLNAAGTPQAAWIERDEERVYLTRRQKP